LRKQDKRKNKVSKICTDNQSAQSKSEAEVLWKEQMRKPFPVP